MHSLVQLTLVRFREFIREPEAVFWTFVFPPLLAAGLATAFRHRPPEALHVAVVARDSAARTSLAAALAKDSGLAVEVLDSAGARRALSTGRLALVVVQGSPPVYEFDPTRPEGRSARLLVNNALQRGAGRRDPVAVADVAVSEPGSRYIDFFLPGLLGMNLMGGGIWGIGFSIVTARNKKLLKRLVATPMSRLEYLMSYLISRLLFLILEVVVLLGFGVLVFGVPLRGSLVVLAIVCLVSGLAFSALGLLIASRSTTTEGVQGLMNLAMMPMYVLSGVFFSSQNFPAVTQPFIKALPLTASVDAVRANMLQGAGLTTLWPQMAILTAWLAVSLAIALKIFRWR